MKAKSVLFLTISFVLIGTVLFVLMNCLGVQVIGSKWAQFAFFVANGFAGVVLWEFFGSVSK